jgi:hypothetical protein
MIRRLRDRAIVLFEKLYTINAFSLLSVSDADIAAAEARVKQARQRLAHAIKVTLLSPFLSLVLARFSQLFL